MADEKLDLTTEDQVQNGDTSPDDVPEPVDNVFDKVEDSETAHADDLDAPVEDVAEDHHDVGYPEEHHDHDHEHDHDDTEEKSPSLSSRILTWLVLMAIGAGLVLWGGPKLAPNLPAWAAPLARVLTPGGDQALQEVAALRGELTEQIASIEPEVDEAGILSSAAQNAADGDVVLAKRLDALEALVTESPQAEILSRIATLETRQEGVSAAVASLNETLSEAITSGGDMSAETLAQLAAKDAVIEGLKAEMAELTSQMSDLRALVEDTNDAMRTRTEAMLNEAQNAERKAAEMAKLTAIQEKLSALRSTARSGAAFRSQLDAYVAESNAEIPDVIAANAASGLPELAVLEEDFASASHLALREAIKSEAGDGTLSRVGAFLQSQVATRSLAPQEGDTTDAILSRMGSALSSDQLGTVLDEAEALDETARQPLAAFLNKVRLRFNVLRAIDSLSVQAS